MVRRLRGLALLLVVASAVPASAETYALNLTGNSTWAAQQPWESLVSGSLAVTAPNGTYPEIRDGNGSLLWAWAGRNVSVSAAWYSGDPYVGANGINGHLGSQFTEVPVDLGNATCAGNASLAVSFPSGFAEAWTTTPFVLAAVAGDNYSAAPFWNATVGLVQNAAFPLAWTIPLPANASRVWLREINDTATGPTALYTGNLKLGSASATAAVVPGCAAEQAVLGGGLLPLRFNGSGNFSASGTATTDAWNVTAWASVNGANVSGAVLNLTASGGASYSISSPGSARVKAGTYAATVLYGGVGCESGPFQVKVERDDGAGCKLTAPAPAPAPARPVAAAGGGGGGGGGSEPAPEAPAPSQSPPAATEPARAGAKAAFGSSSSSSSPRAPPGAAEGVARAMADVITAIPQGAARQNEAYSALGEAIARWGGVS